METWTESSSQRGREDCRPIWTQLPSIPCYPAPCMSRSFWTPTTILPTTQVSPLVFTERSSCISQRGELDVTGQSRSFHFTVFSVLSLKEQTVSNFLSLDVRPPQRSPCSRSPCSSGPTLSGRSWSLSKTWVRLPVNLNLTGNVLTFTPLLYSLYQGCNLRS